MKLKQFEREQLHLDVFPPDARPMQCIEYRRLLGFPIAAVAKSVVSDRIYAVWVLGIVIKGD